MATLITGRSGTSITGSAGADILAGDSIIDNADLLERLTASVGSANGSTDGVNGGTARFDLDGRTARNVLLNISVGEGAYDGGIPYGKGGNNNSLFAFNDTINGGSGNDQIVGDVLARDGDSTVLYVSIGNRGGYDDFYEHSGEGGSGNSVTAFRDTLIGGLGNDTIIGDIRTTVAGAQIGLGIGVAWGGDAPYGSRNTANVFNDSISGGDGTDILVGDVMAVSGGRAWIGSFAGSGSYTRYLLDPPSGGDFNRITGCCDTLAGGAGSDRLVGDVRFEGGNGSVELWAVNARSGPGGYDSGSEGNGGNNNVIVLCNDSLTGDAGRDALAGDVRCEARGNEISLYAGAGCAVSFRLVGSDGGDNNQVYAFNDSLAGGDDNDRIVGDVHLLAGANDVAFYAYAGAGANDDGAYSGYGDGGNNNRVVTSADRLAGGTGDDWLVGDLLNNAGSVSVSFVVDCGIDGSDPASVGGTGNVVTAWNDTLVGDAGNDVLVGDVWGVAGSTLAGLDIDIAGKAGNTVSAFQDSLDGGAGNDALWGDFFDGSGGVAPSDLDIAGAFAGRSLLFADTLTGGAGTDTLAGGLGADVLTGGSEADRFVWAAGDLTALVASGAKPVDRVTDFRAAGAGLDVLDLGDLLASLGFGAGDAASDWLRLRRDGASSVVSIDANGEVGGAAFADAIRLEGFVTTLSLQQLIDDGVILIA